jgi:ribosomal protein L11 methyltransferase
MNRKADKWYAVSVTLAPKYAEAAEFAFNNLDSLGSEIDLLSNTGSNLLTVTAYFSSTPNERSIQSELTNAARIHGLPDNIDFAVEQAIIEDQDWLAEWKKYWKPSEIGRFIIAAPWHEIDGADKIVIRIEPNMAFGTGTHETTQLCLAAIDENYRPGESFLDVGTGTGILAIAAALMSDWSPPIVAVDTDDQAIAIARTNADLNRVSDRVEFWTGSADAAAGRFDLICANLTADVIVPMLPDLIHRAGSTLVLSGILAEQEQIVLNALPKDLDFFVTRSGEWIAVIVETGGRKERPA